MEVDSPPEANQQNKKVHPPVRMKFISATTTAYVCKFLSKYKWVSKRDTSGEFFGKSLQWINAVIKREKWKRKETSSSLFIFTLEEQSVCLRFEKQPSHTTVRGAKAFDSLPDLVL